MHLLTANLVMHRQPCTFHYKTQETGSDCFQSFHINTLYDDTTSQTLVKDIYYTLENKGDSASLYSNDFCLVLEWTFFWSYINDSYHTHLLLHFSCIFRDFPSLQCPISWKANLTKVANLTIAVLLDLDWLLGVD